MLVIKIEIWPLGSKDKAREIARAYISNDGVQTEETNGEFGSYNAYFMKNSRSGKQRDRHKKSDIWKIGRAENVNRIKRGVWDILYLCLKSIGMETRN